MEQEQNNRGPVYETPQAHEVAISSPPPSPTACDAREALYYFAAETRQDRI